jgi:hypothetical protein
MNDNTLDTPSPSSVAGLLSSPAEALDEPILSRPLRSCRSARRAWRRAISPPAPTQRRRCRASFAPCNTDSRRSSAGKHRVSREKSYWRDQPGRRFPRGFSPSHHRIRMPAAEQEAGGAVPRGSVGHDR